MAAKSVAVTVGVAAVVLVTGNGDKSDARPWYVYNNSGATIYVGGSTVTTATGTPVPAATGLAGASMSGDDVYGIAAGAGNDVRVFTQRSS